MENSQLQLPIQTPNWWEKTNPQARNEAIEIMAQLIVQIFNENSEDAHYGHSNSKRPENL